MNFSHNAAEIEQCKIRNQSLSHVLKKWGETKTPPSTASTTWAVSEQSPLNITGTGKFQYIPSSLAVGHNTWSTQAMKSETKKASAIQPQTAPGTWHEQAQVNQTTERLSSITSFRTHQCLKMWYNGLIKKKIHVFTNIWHIVSKNCQNKCVPLMWEVNYFWWLGIGIMQGIPCPTVWCHIIKNR